MVFSPLGAQCDMGLKSAKYVGKGFAVQCFLQEGRCFLIVPGYLWRGSRMQTTRRRSFLVGEMDFGDAACFDLLVVAGCAELLGRGILAGTLLN